MRYILLILFCCSCGLFDLPNSINQTINSSTTMVAPVLGNYRAEQEQKRRDLHMKQEQEHRENLERQKQERHAVLIRQEQEHQEVIAKQRTEELRTKAEAEEVKQEAELKSREVEAQAAAKENETRAKEAEAEIEKAKAVAEEHKATSLEKQRELEKQQFEQNKEEKVALERASELRLKEARLFIEELEKRAKIEKIKEAREKEKNAAKRAEIAAKNAEQQAQQSAAYLAVCGEAPKRSGWDGSLEPVRNFLRKAAHNPDSITFAHDQNGVDGCTVPQLTKKKCWVATCKFRGSNSFGAMVLNTIRFYMTENEVVGVGD